MKTTLITDITIAAICAGYVPCESGVNNLEEVILS